MESKPSSYFYLEKKKGHDDAVISIDVLESNTNILATGSDDHSVRLWDLRMNSSIKRFRDQKMMEKSVSNAKLSPDGTQLYVGASNSIFVFDLKTDKILIEAATFQKEATEDEINFVTLDASGQFMASCDDSGAITIFNPENLEVEVQFKNGHTNIPFTVEFFNPSDKAIPYCVSSGFDCQLIIWDLEKKCHQKVVNINELCSKYIPGQLVCPPLVYNVTTKASTILASVETGHIIALNYKEPKKPKYIIDAHLGKVMRTTFARFKETILVSISTDLSFAMWDIEKRTEAGVPSFMKRIEIPEKPNWVETTNNKQVLTCDTSPFLYIYTLKDS